MLLSYHGSLNNITLTDTICTSDCLQSLKGWYVKPPYLTESLRFGWVNHLNFAKPSVAVGLTLLRASALGRHSMVQPQ
jgi:hypothetical protein